MALGFYFDMTRCIGCRACQVACKDKNRLDVGTIYRTADSYEVGTFPKVKMYSFSTSCNHCQNPACVSACPVGAMYKAEDGTVLHDDKLCIGCQACVSACPYDVPQYIEEKKVVGKCDACAAIRAAGGQPACVAACPNRCLDFGDMDELKAKYGSALVSELPVFPGSDTQPCVLIKAKDCAKKELGEKLYL